MSNATLACRTCNQDKGARMPEEWHEGEAVAKARKGSKKKLAKARIFGIDKVLASRPNSVSDRDCTWMSASGRYEENGLFDRRRDVECASGAGRSTTGSGSDCQKDHHYDALCVGTVPEQGYRDRTDGLHVRAMSRGTRLRGQINACGVIRVKYRDRGKRRFGFRNGDIVAADVPQGKHVGHHVG